MTSIEEVFRRLTLVVGEEGVLREAEGLRLLAKDSKITGVPPLLAAMPTSTTQVQKIMAICHGARLPVVPRGAGTGTVGGAVCEGPALVLDLGRMKRIMAPDPVSMTVGVEAGVITRDLQLEVEKAGLFYPPDPASADSCTIGGNAATNAGGLRAMKYGVTGDYILSMDLVLADGELLHTGANTLKTVVGYDLKSLFIGSEGTLGVICELCLRLSRTPPARRTMVASFPDIPSCVAGVEAVLAGPVLPAAMELVDGESVRAVEEAGKGPVAFPAPFLLIEVDGREAMVAEEIRMLDELLRGLNAETRVAANDDESRGLWDARRAISEALKEVSPKKMAEDVVVPLSRLAALLRGIKELAEPKGLTHVAYGHAGDGNLHVNILYDPEKPGVTERVRVFRSELFDLTLRLGGSISGEHGVGIAKRPFIDRELSAVSLRVHQAIKTILDPENILNPGKIWIAPPDGVAGA